MEREITTEILPLPPQPESYVSQFVERSSGGDQLMSTQINLSCITCKFQLRLGEFARMQAPRL